MYRQLYPDNMARVHLLEFTNDSGAPNLVNCTFFKVCTEKNCLFRLTSQRSNRSTETATARSALEIDARLSLDLLNNLMPIPIQ